MSVEKYDRRQFLAGMAATAAVGAIAGLPAVEKYGRYLRSFNHERKRTYLPEFRLAEIHLPEHFTGSAGNAYDAARYVNDQVMKVTSGYKGHRDGERLVRELQGTDLMALVDSIRGFGMRRIRFFIADEESRPFEPKGDLGSYKVKEGDWRIPGFQRVASYRKWEQDFDLGYLEKVDCLLFLLEKLGIDAEIDLADAYPMYLAQQEGKALTSPFIASDICPGRSLDEVVHSLITNRGCIEALLNRYEAIANYRGPFTEQRLAENKCLKAVSAINEGNPFAVTESVSWEELQRFYLETSSRLKVLFPGKTVIAGPGQWMQIENSIKYLSGKPSIDVIPCHIYVMPPPFDWLLGQRSLKEVFLGSRTPVYIQELGSEKLRHPWLYPDSADIYTAEAFQVVNDQICVCDPKQGCNTILTNSWAVWRVIGADANFPNRPINNDFCRDPFPMVPGGMPLTREQLELFNDLVSQAVKF
jgi:hypothetical protein